MKKESFTINDGMARQEMDLAEWKKILTAKAFDVLITRVESANKELRQKKDATGYDVWRGQDIDDVVHSLKHVVD